MRIKTALWLSVICTGLVSSAWAQEEAPQVLTSDLALQQVIESERLTVNFVVVDEDNITRITIDGEDQEFEPADTVLITKEFVFTPGRHIIRVEAEDEEGNVRKRSWLVALGVPLELEADEGLKINVVFEVRLEVDDNPTQDLSIPFFLDVTDTDIEGSIDDQEDMRTTLKGIALFSSGRLSGFVGLVDTSYSDADNKQFESRAFFLGGELKFSDEGGFQLGAMLADFDLGGNDFSTQITVSPAYESIASDEDGTSRSLYGLDFSLKMFEDRKTVTVDPNTNVGTEETKAIDDGTEITLKRVFRSLDKEKLDSYKGVIALGTRTEGTDESEFNFIGWDGDWSLNWDSGFKWNLGAGYQYRDYPNDDDVLTTDIFGNTRVDNLLRLSTGLGWKFAPFTVMFNYRYVNNLSNDSPYERSIYGLSLKGAF